MRVTTYELRKGRDDLPALVKETSCNYPVIDSARNPEEIWKLMCDVFRLNDALEEYVYVLAFDTAMHLKGVFMISKGTQNYSVSGLREIFSRLLMIRAMSFIMVHNHPSGDVSPSDDDIKVTKKIRDAGELMEIKLLDHVIIGNNTYMSMRENNTIAF